MKVTGERRLQKGIEKVADGISENSGDITMKLKQISGIIDTLSMLTADDVLGTVGLQKRRSTTSSILQATAYVGAGMVVGAGLAMLLTPQSGPELRKKISKGYSEVETKVQHQFSALGSSMGFGKSEAVQGKGHARAEEKSNGAPQVSEDAADGTQKHARAHRAG